LLFVSFFPRFDAVDDGAGGGDDDDDDDDNNDASSPNLELGWFVTTIQDNALWRPWKQLDHTSK
jgi:hypothetical protein